LIKIPLKLLIEISEKRKSQLAKFAGWGLLIGAGTGVAVILSKNEVENAASLGPDFTPIIRGGAIGGFIGLLAGAITGSIIERDKIHDLQDYTVQEKKNYLEKTIIRN